MIENLAAVLAAGGSSLAGVVRTTVYLTDLALFPRMNAVYARYFEQAPAARARDDPGRGAAARRPDRDRRDRGERPQGGLAAPAALNSRHARCRVSWRRFTPLMPAWATIGATRLPVASKSQPSRKPAAMAKTVHGEQLATRDEVRRAEQQARRHEPDLRLERARERRPPRRSRSRAPAASTRRARAAPARRASAARELLAEAGALRELARGQHDDGRRQQPGAERRAAASRRAARRRPAAHSERAPGERRPGERGQQQRAIEDAAQGARAADARDARGDRALARTAGAPGRSRAGRSARMPRSSASLTVIPGGR